MNLKTTLLAATLAVFAASAPISYAEKHMDAKPEAAKEKKTEAKKSMKKHSHMEEKTGIKASESSTPAAKRDPSTTHDHTKEKR